MQQATMQSGARTKHEGHETLIVHVSVVRIRDLLMPKEHLHSNMLLVVSLAEDTRH
jgi:hypothetical protein